MDVPIELKKQIEQERSEIVNAPRVYSGALNTRCHFCGAVGGEVKVVEVLNGIERTKGVACCGA